MIMLSCQIRNLLRGLGIKTKKKKIVLIPNQTRNYNVFKIKINQKLTMEAVYECLYKLTLP